MFGIELLNSALGLVAAVSAVIGIVAGSLLGDYVFPTFVEHRKQKQELARIYDKYSHPLRLASHELAFRLFSILEGTHSNYLISDVAESKPNKLLNNTSDDPYHMRYRFLSTVYRLCAFFGWLELYRQETIYLRPLDEDKTRALEDSIGRLRSNLATGVLGNKSGWDTWVETIQEQIIENTSNAAANWSNWFDQTIYREEIRAIGQSLIITQNESRTVMGFADFVDYYESYQENTTQRWAKVVSNFFIDLGTRENDFRHIRLGHFVVSLVDLMKALGDRPVDPTLLDRQKRLKIALVDPIEFNRAMTDQR